MALIQCPTCGHSISDKAVHCPKCGEPVSTQTYQTPSYNAGAYPVENMNSGNNGKKTAIIVVSIVAAILAIVVVFLLVRNHNKQDYSYDVYYDSTEAVEEPVAESADADNSFLEAAIQSANQGLPEEVDEGMVMEKITLEGDYITYTCLVDEDLYSISEIRAAQSEIKKNMKEYLFGTDDSSTSDFRSICRSNHKGAAFKYVGRRSGQSYTIYIRPSEM